MSPSSTALKGWVFLPFRMLRRQRLHLVDREGQLEIDRLLGPQCAVIVEGGDALGRLDVVWRPLPGDALDKAGDGLLRRTVISGGKRVCLSLRGWGDSLAATNAAKPIPRKSRRPSA
jgi:hypothetical protein